MLLQQVQTAEKWHKIVGPASSCCELYGSKRLLELLLTHLSSNELSAFVYQAIWNNKLYAFIGTLQRERGKNV